MPLPEINETGNRYGKLVVVERQRPAGRHGIRWICRCDCGVSTVFLGSALRRKDGKNVSSCGCDRGRLAINEIGNRYGRLVVTERQRAGPNPRGARWICRCDCGDETVAAGWSLRAGKAKSCGCVAPGIRMRPFGLFLAVGT
jgi:hypothetical protein